jgi:dTDP-4-amino-4,6-dideoxygalactose transaminase
MNFKNHLQASETKRINLSLAEVGELEEAFIQRAITSGWITTLGPDVELFEKEIAQLVGRDFAVALSSGTAALHLAYKACGVGVGDEVVIPTMTFGATAFPVQYLGANPVFLDVDKDSLTLDTNLLAEFLRHRKKINRLPRAIVPVDLYGVPCNYDDLVDLSSEFEVPLVCDAAESVGSRHQGKPIGSIGQSSIFSFNGNKIITTSGGGMLLTDDEQVADKVRYWAAQSREPVVWYEHKEIGYNYRLSNILAALGCAQLKRLPEFVAKRRQIRSWYTDLLSDLEGLSVMQDPAWGKSNAWLTVILFDLKIYPNAPERFRQALERENIESRPIWKPLHRQPVFSNCETCLTGVADEMFSRGLCLPSGSALTHEQISRVADVIKNELTTK